MMTKYKYKWSCNFSMGTGLDREDCRKEGRWTKFLDKAIGDGKAHNEKHWHSKIRWRGPSCGKVTAVSIIRKEMKNGEESVILRYDEL